MSDTVVRSYSAPEPVSSEPAPEVEKSDKSTEAEYKDIEPMEGAQADEAILSAIGVSEVLGDLPSETQENVNEIKDYLLNNLDKKGVSPTATNIKNLLDKTKEDFGLDANASPEKVLDRIGGVIKSWKSLTFINDAKEKKNIMRKLASFDSAKEMNKYVFDVMNKYEVWE